VTRTDARGVVANYTYDILNRLTGISYTIPNGSGVGAMPNVCDPLGGTNISANVCLTYGTSSAQFNNGRVTTMTDGVGSENYTYNNLGQMTQLQKVISGTTYTTGYAYNVADELTQITYPSTRAVSMPVDAIGRLSAVSGTLNSVNTTYASGFAYNPASQATGFQYGNSLFASFGFSPDLLQLNCLDYSTTNRNGTCVHDATTKFGLTYSYGSAGSNNGLVSGITDSVDNGRSASYSYDALYRLSSAVTTGSTAYPQWGLSMTYDRYGNRTAQSISAGCVAPMRCPTNSVTVDVTTNRISGSPYSYDLSGNMTNDGNNTLVYDGENRVVSASGSLGSGGYVYDGNSLRVKKCVPNCSSPTTTTVYLFSGSKVIAEYQNGAAPSTPTKEYIYSGGQLLATVTSSSTTYHHPDHLSVRTSTDTSGNILKDGQGHDIGSQGHFPYGETWYLGSAGTKWEFTTYKRDSESGNDYAMARYDVSRLGRFSSPDPVAGSTGDPQSLNRYSYVRNMPVEATDPSGLSSCDDTSMNLPDEGEERGAFLLASYRVSEAEPEPVHRLATAAGAAGAAPARIRASFRPIPSAVPTAVATAC
jgi:RHS repeat-associated protein